MHTLALVCNGEFQEEWAINHPNPAASSYYLDIFYNGMLATEQYMLTSMIIDLNASP